MHKFLCVLQGLLFTIAVQAQLDVAKKHVEKLCSPEFHGRGYVAGGDSIAAAYLAESFLKLGVAPTKDSYFQTFSFDVNTFPGKMKIQQGTKQLTPGIDFLVDPGSGHFHGEIAPGFIEDKDLTDDNFGVRLKQILDNDSLNAIAFDLTQINKEKHKDLRGIYTDLMMICPVLILTDAKLTWSASTRQFIYPLIELRKEMYSAGSPLHLSIDAELVNNHQARNVSAFIPSEKKNAKTILFTAHYDHLGRMGEKTYFPGGNDNASGTTMLLSLAEYYKKNPSKYNIQFIAFAGEEAGLIGSKYYVQNPQKPLSEIKFLLNLDIMGSGEEGITVVNATLHKKAFKCLQKINKKKKYLQQIKSRGPAANSDHYWFSEQGVPAFFIYTMGPNKHYHDVQDTYEELSFSEYEDLIKLMVDFVGK